MAKYNQHKTEQMLVLRPLLMHQKMSSIQEMAVQYLLSFTILASLGDMGSGLKLLKSTSSFPFSTGCVAVKTIRSLLVLAVLIFPAVFTNATSTTRSLPRERLRSNGPYLAFGTDLNFNSRGVGYKCVCSVPVLNYHNSLSWYLYAFNFNV